MKSTPSDRREILKSLRPPLVSAVLLVLSSGTFAQAALNPDVHQITRAEVRHELNELASVGYHQPVGNNPYYPGDIQAAEQRVEAKRQAQVTASMAGHKAVEVESRP
ncbi:DUF4148 domain-containing protein [Paraburkholderia sp. J7]|uniref:DUF4148 domain-containing protein n=1 Tax=Paraburkholderia sp. J7 TaxID=2805438 RepID=UPI002AB696F6|nr:DUF4148 domain-containing protein [Paraburkholderia sp. J7]